MKQQKAYVRISDAELDRVAQLPHIVCDGDREAGLILKETSQRLKTEFPNILKKGE